MRRICIDGGKEFEGGWDEWATCHGIILERTPVYSSSANGIAERKHGITFAMVHAILHDLGLPQNMWAMAAAYVVYTENLLPSTRNGVCVPAELERDKTSLTSDRLEQEPGQPLSMGNRVSWI